MDMRTFTIFIKKYSQIHEFYVVPSVKYTESLYQPIKDFKIREMAGLTISRLFGFPVNSRFFPIQRLNEAHLRNNIVQKI